MVAETETNGILPFHQESSKTITLQRKYWKFNFFILLKVIHGICKTNLLTYIPMTTDSNIHHVYVSLLIKAYI